MDTPPFQEPRRREDEPISHRARLPEKFPTGAPREAPNADRPGDYRIAIRTVEGEVDPGGEIRLEIFVIGYGVIRGSKLGFYPPPYFIDAEASKAFGDPVIAEGQWRWGAGEGITIGEAGFSTIFAGVQGDTWEESSRYIDIAPDPPDKERLGVAHITTETKIGEHAPIEMILKVRDGAPTGNHNLHVYFTYYNGSEWKTDSQTVVVLVRNWVRRHETVTVVVGLIVAATALIASLGSFILDLLSYLYNI